MTIAAAQTADQVRRVPVGRQMTSAPKHSVTRATHGAADRNQCGPFGEATNVQFRAPDALTERPLLISEDPDHGRTGQPGDPSQQPRVQARRRGRLCSDVWPPAKRADEDGVRRAWLPAVRAGSRFCHRGPTGPASVGSRRPDGVNGISRG